MDTSIFKALPKVDLHRHLEGSIRLTTLQDILRSNQYGIMLNADEIPALVQMMPDEAFTHRNFLAKFATLRLFFQSPEIIQRLVDEAIEDAARDGLLYLELNFTPVALARAQNFSIDDVIGWVCESARQAAAKHHLPTRLIASINRHEPLAMAEQVIRAALDHYDQGIGGLCLAGNEAEFSSVPFVPLLRAVKQTPLKLTIHAGEWSGAENVHQAIETIGADRIGHGVRVLEDADVVAVARERQVLFEVCVTSNVQTGIAKSVNEHPFPNMLAAGLNASLHTDDPSISNITLSDEYCLAHKTLGIGLDQLSRCTQASIAAAFTPQTEKARLFEQFHARQNHANLFLQSE